MTTDEAIRHFGGVQKLADALGIDRRSVWKWGKYPPPGRQFELEVNTDGALTAERSKNHGDCDIEAGAA